MGKRNRYEGELSLNSFALDGTVKGYAQLGESMASRITAEYKFLEGKTNKINIQGKMRNLSANALIKYNGLLNLQASLLPEWNTELSFETMRTTGHIENTVSVSLGDGARSRVHNIRLQEILRYEGDLKNNKIDGSFSVVYPEKNIDYAVKVSHENTESSLRNNLDVQYDRSKHILSEIQLNVNQDTPFSVSGDVKLKYPGRDTALSASVSETNPKEYTATMSYKWQEGRQASLVVNYKDKTDSSRLKYEVEGELNVPLRSPITFSSVLGSQRGQFAGFAEMNVGVDKYRVKADYAKGNGNWNHRASGQLIFNNIMYGLEAALQNAGNKLSCNAEVKMPNRHRITAKFEGRTGDFIQTGSFETLWDADRDSSKRFGLNGELRSHAEGYESKVIVQIRRRTVTGTLSTSLKGKFLGSQWNTNNKIEVEWSPSEKVTAAFSSNMLLDRSRQEANGQLEITTPYINYENMSISLSHFYANQQWESELSTLLPKRNEIQFSTSGKYLFNRDGATVESKTRLQTTFSQLSDAYLEISHDHSSRELTSKMQFRWAPNRRVTLDASAVAQPSVYKGSLKFTSPFKNFEDLSTEIIHNYSPDHYRTRTEFQWAPRRKVSLNFEGKHVLNGRSRLCTVSVRGSSPFQDFENTAAKISYTNDGTTLNTDVELNWSERKKIVTSFMASMRNSRYNKNIESKFLVTTPFRNYESYQISTSLETNRNSYKVNVDAQLPYRSTASLNSQGKFLGLNDIELNAVVIGHFPRYMQPQRTSIDFVHKYQNSKLRSSLDTAYNNHRLTVLLNGLAEFGYDTRNIEFSATVNTPFSGYEEMKCNLNHNMRGYEYITKLEANKNALSGTFTHKLSFRDAFNFETTVDVASSEFPDAKLSIIQVYNGGRFEHNSYTTWSRNRRITFNAQFLDKSIIKELTLKLTTPFRNYRELELKSSYEHQNWDHKAALSINVDRRHKITLNKSFRNYRWKNVNAQVDFTSTFRGYESHSASFKYDLTAPDKSVEVSYVWDPENRQAVTLKGNFLHSYSLTNAKLEATTPFKNFNQITFSTKFENNSPEYILNVVYTRESRRIVLNGKALLRKHKSEILVDFQSPFESIKNVKSVARYEISEKGFSTMISFDWNREKYLIKGEYRLVGGAAGAKLNLLTPFRGFRTIDIQSDVNYGGAEVQGDLVINWEKDNNIVINALYSKRRNGRGLKIDIRTSFDNYEQINFDTSYKAVPGLYEGELKTSLSRDKVYEGKIAIKSDEDHLFDIKVEISSPDDRLRNLKLAATIDSERDSKRVESSFKLNENESTFAALFKHEGDRFFETNIRLDTPYQNFRMFSLQSSLTRNSYESIDARLKLETPFDVLRKLDVQTEAKTENSESVASFYLSTPHNKFNLKSKVSNLQFQPFNADVEIDTSFLSIKKFSAIAEINIVQWDNSKMILSLSTPRSKHLLDTALLKDENFLNFHFKVESPAIPASLAVITFKSSYENEKNIEAECSLQLFGDVHYLNGQISMSDKNSEVQIRLVSPQLPEKKADITASLHRRRNNKNIEGKLSFTIPSSTHEITLKYESKNSQIIGNLKIDSSILKSSPFEAQAKYTNSNGKDLEASFTATTPEATHSIIASLKNYDGEKYVELKVECPTVGLLNSLSITGTLKQENFEAVEGSLSIAARGKVLRIAGNMKNDQ